MTDLELRLGLVVLPVVAVGAAAVGILALLVFTSGDDGSGGAAASGQCSTVAGDSSVQVGDLTAEQLANAQTIVAVGRQLEVPAYGWVIAVATALQTNLTHGHLDSLGLFQQRDAWGSRDERLNAEAAARMFYTGGRNGQKGLTQVAGFESMPLSAAAQAVQQSAFPDANGRWESLAKQIVANPVVLSARCYTAVDYEGDGTPGSNAVASALQVLGTPYRWGGGGIGGPGKGFGPGGDTVGFDCSSLVQYAYHRATGQTVPGVTGAQAAALPAVPPGTSLKAGDLLFFHSPGDAPGSYHHVGIRRARAAWSTRQGPGRLSRSSTRCSQTRTSVRSWAASHGPRLMSCLSTPGASHDRERLRRPGPGVPRAHRRRGTSCRRQPCPGPADPQSPRPQRATWVGAPSSS